MRRCLALLVVLVPEAARGDILSHMLDGDGASPAADDLLAWSGPPQDITLPDLLQIAVRQAPSLQSARIDVAIAEAQIEETFVRNDWLVKAQASGARSTGGLLFGLPLDSNKSFTASGDLIRNLYTGAQIDLHASTQYSDLAVQGIPESKAWLDTISLSVTQPLLKGRGREMFDASERKARIVKDVDVLANRLAAIQVVEAVVAAYWDLVLAERQVGITQQSLDLAHERLRVTTIGAEGGKTARSEIPAVEQIIATREEDLLNAELAVLVASINVRRAAGMPIGAGQLGLRVATDFEIQDVTWQLGPLLDKAYAASPELAQLAKQTEASTIDIEVTENGLLPQLDLALSIAPSGQDTTFTTAGKNLAEVKQLQISGSLTYSRSLEQSDVKGRARELRTQRQKIAVNAVDVRAQYAKSLATAVSQLEVAKRRVVLSQKAIELANENIRIETDRFNLGRSTNFDVLNRLEELRQAELRRTQAMIDWHKAEVVVRALTGDILPMYGITVD
jgi:outer membrane protein TolC